MSGGAYFDYQWNFPTSGLALALQGLDVLRAELSLDHGVMPGNALGDPRDVNGDIVVPSVRDIGDPPDTSVAWIGRPGSAAYSYTDPTGKTVDVPANGDPGRYYMHIRSATTSTFVVFDPAQYGLMTTDPAESAAVLGVWAGDEVPT